MLKKVYDSPEMEITRISFHAIMEDQHITTSGGVGNVGDEGLFE